MNGRERVTRALNFQSVDKAPLQYYCTKVGFYEHGEKLNTLYAAHPGDFEPFVRQPIPVITDSQRDGDGRYHELITDGWGVTWEYRIFGIAGIVKQSPLADISRLDSYTLPPLPDRSNISIILQSEQVSKHKQEYFYQYHTGTLFEQLRALRGDEDLYCDLAEDSPQINLLADKIAERSRALAEYAVDIGADAIAFGDDYGTERSLICSPAMWRAFFKPRLKAVFEPAVKAGLKVIFHSCGVISDILEDLAQIGVSAIWPQLPAYDMKSLAERCKALGLAVAIHTDRANVMTFGSPSQVAELVKREYETFKMGDGGSWFYVEADNGFPFENIRALVETIAEYR